MRNNEQRARTAIILLWIILGLDIAMGVSSFFQLDLLYRMETGLDYNDQEVNINDIREAVIGILYTVAYITSIITFIRWFRRAYFNLHQSTDNVVFSEGWAAGAWFVPILNLFRPFQIMKELYTKTNKLLIEIAPDYDKKSNLFFVNFWWGLWVVSNLIANRETRSAFNADTIQEIITYTELSIATSFLGVPVALLAIKVIKDYSQMEKILFKSNIQKLNSDISKLDFTNDNDILDALE